MTEKELIQRSLSCLHASENTVQEVIHMAETKKSTHRGRTIALVALAACLIFALAVGVAASEVRTFRLDEPISMDRIIDDAFGTGIAGHDAYEVDTGLSIEQYPAVLRVPADAVLAEQLIGYYYNELGEGLRFGGYTVSLHGYFLDENGVGVLAFEVENPDGIGLCKYATGIGDTVPPLIFHLTDSRGNAVDMNCFAETGSFSDTHALYFAYITPFFPFEPGMTLTFSIEWMMEDESSGYSCVLAPEKRIPAKSFEAGGIRFSVSPLGFVTDAEYPPAGSLSLVFADGSEYLVESDTEHNFASSSIIRDGGIGLAFNRLVDPENISSVKLLP